MATKNETPKHGFGSRIATARKAAGFSQKALMEVMGWPNESNSRLSGYENESRQPSLEDFETIAEACGVEPAWLAFDRRPMRRKVAA